MASRAALLAHAVVIVTGAGVAHAEAVDLPSELRAIGSKALPKNSGIIQWTPVAGAGCESLTKSEHAAMKKRVLAWIDSQHPDEIDQGGMTILTVGCREPSGTIAVDASQDREPKSKTPDRFALRRNYLLRVATDAIDIVSESTTTASDNWMEWADEGRIALLGQVDIDGDGALDLVWSNHEHEGGAVSTSDQLHVLFATGRTADSVQITNLADVELVKDQLVVAGETRDGTVAYGCMDKTLHVASCAAAAALQKRADRNAIAVQFVGSSETPRDRELLAQQLAALGVAGKRKASLVAAAPQTLPIDRAKRHVAAFLQNAGLTDPMDDLVQQSHPQASMYLDDLATKLGDHTCTQVPLTTEDTTLAKAWLAKQDSAPADTAIQPSACGSYMWVAWTPGTPGHDVKRREVLLGRDGTRLLGFSFSDDNGGEGWRGAATAHAESFFAHGNSIVGIVMFDRHVWIVANGKVVGESTGDIAMYRYDDRWNETSIDVYADGGALWRATPTGREKLDRALVQDHEAHRAAFAMVNGNTPTHAAPYIAALELLGADKALVAECKKLP